ncbi:GNAT family N-acetyltransferase [Ideonella sp.]|uniref:GNAT family N-acetyltransferase n=1 Tax=Ideonella sp. TaxID=1929293 RepID=UPI0035B2F920
MHLHPSMSFTPGTALPPATWHAAFTEAFADYLIGPFTLTLAQWPGFLARQGVSLSESRATVDAGGQITAFALVAPRPAVGRWRLAVMGARPAARGSGAAAGLLADFLARAAAAGVGRVELEVFAQNTRAVRLYEKHGFAVAQGLFGHELAPGAGPACAASPAATTPALAAHDVALDEAAAWLDAAEQRVPDLPLQVGAGSLRAAEQAAPGSLAAARAGDAQIVWSSPAEPAAVVVHSLVDPSAGQAGAEALLRALQARHPGRTLRVPPLQRDDLGGLAWQRLGAARQRLHQWLMTRPLAA